MNPFITRKQWAQFVKDDYGDPDWRTIQELENLDLSASTALDLLTPQLGVDRGGTGVQSFPLGAVLLGNNTSGLLSFPTTANRSLWGAGAAGIDDDAGFTRTGDAGRYLFGATDNGADKVQLLGGLALDVATMRASGGNTVFAGNTASGITLNGGISSAGTAGALVFTAGASATGTTGDLTLTVPGVTGAAGSAGQASLNGGNGAGAGGVGTSWLMTTGNGTLTDGVFTWRDNAGTFSMTFAPKTGDFRVPGGAQFIRTNTALTNSAAAAAATLLNAPVAGNPTKWIGINDNGTLRQIPAW